LLLNNPWKIPRKEAQLAGLARKANPVKPGTGGAVLSGDTKQRVTRGPTQWASDGVHFLLVTFLCASKEKQLAQAPVWRSEIALKAVSMTPTNPARRARINRSWRCPKGAAKPLLNLQQGKNTH